MTAELSAYAPPNAEAFVRAWLLPLVDDAEAIGSKRWAAGMATPYWVVTRVAGRRTEDADYPTIRVHYFNKTYTLASRGATETDRRMLLLERDPSHDVVLPGGSLANCDYLECTESFHEEPYAAESVVTRFVAEYRLGLSFVAV